MAKPIDQGLSPITFPYLRARAYFLLVAGLAVLISGYGPVLVEGVNRLRGRIRCRSGRYRLGPELGVPNIMLDVDANGTPIITPPYPFHRAVAVAATGGGLPSETHTFGSERD